MNPPPPVFPPGSLAGLGNVVREPIFAALLKYWWVTVPVGYLGWHYWNERKGKGTASVGGLIHDLAPAVSVVAALISVNEVLRQRQTPVAGPVRDAAFTVQAKPAAAGTTNG